MTKKMEKSKFEGRSVERKAVIDRSAINEEERRVSILISTESPVRLTDWWSGEQYDEVLLHGEENVDMTRAKTAKLRYMHGAGEYGELPIGRLENIRLENRELRADAIFSTANPDAEMLWRMVLEGTMTEISVGGKRSEVRITEREGDVPLVEVVRWEFIEASLVDVGADPKAGIGRQYDNDKGEIVTKLEELKRQLAAMQADKKPDAAKIEKLNADIAAEIERVDVENKELKRKMDIKDIASKHDVADDVLERFLSDSDKTADDFARFLLDEKAKSSANTGVHVGDDNKAQEMQRAIGDALVMRAGFDLKDKHRDADMFRSSSLQDIARAVTGYSGHDKRELVKRAMSTSDFPVLLGNVANRVLAQSYEAAQATFDMWTAATELNDFKDRTEVSRSSFAGRLQKLTEYGEPKKKEVEESSEKWRLYSYGASAKLSREAIINDDLGAFLDRIIEFGDMARRTANGLVYDLLQGKGEFANYKMADGRSVFHADHANLDATGAALGTSALTSARTKMRRQKDAAGNALNINPSFLIVSPENETVAYQLLNSEADIGANQSGVANPFKNSLQPIVESELDALPWYLAANRRTIKVGYLAGTGRKPIVEEKERNLRFVEFDCVFDFGLFAEDFRGLYKNAGK